LVEIRSVVLLTPVTREVINAEVIGEHEDNVGASDSGTFRREHQKDTNE
jgi:hypothetical protein